MARRDRRCRQPQQLGVAVLTVSDSRTEDTDTSGRYFCEQLEAAGHRLEARALVADDVYRIRAVISAWIAAPEVDAVLVTGGTGFSGRDSTPEAVRPAVTVCIRLIGIARGGLAADPGTAIGTGLFRHCGGRVCQ